MGKEGRNGEGKRLRGRTPGGDPLSGWRPCHSALFSGKCWVPAQCQSAGLEINKAVPLPLRSSGIGLGAV